MRVLLSTTAFIFPPTYTDFAEKRLSAWNSLRLYPPMTMQCASMQSKYAPRKINKNALKLFTMETHITGSYFNFLRSLHTFFGASVPLHARNKQTELRICFATRRNSFNAFTSKTAECVLMIYTASVIFNEKFSDEFLIILLWRDEHNQQIRRIWQR